MSAFVCVYERSGEPLDRGELARLAEPLAGDGGEVATLCEGGLGIAIRHRGGRAALDRHGPIVDRETGTFAAVAGRFDVVGTPGAGGADRARAGGRAGCAREVLAWSEPERQLAFLAALCGSFVVLSAEPHAGRLSVARDHLGDLKVYYACSPRRFLAASEAAVLLRDPSVSGELDEVAVARFLGFRFGRTERSFFRGIRELPPAHRLVVTARSCGIERYWRFRDRASSPRSERPPVEFRRSLRTAMERSIGGVEPHRVGLSLSGGLDSTALAAVAPRGVRAYSWFFEETPDSEERGRIEAVAEHLDLPLSWVRGDRHHPLSDGFIDRFVHPSSPYVNPFAALKGGLYERAREDGCELMVVGDGGDALYEASVYWLRETLAYRRTGALRALLGAVGRALRGDRFSRSALSRLWPARGRFGLSRSPSTPWLTAAARAALPEEAHSPIVPPGRPDDRYERIVGVRHTELESEERRLFDLCGVGRASPYWSWPLLEWVIHLPAHWYHRDGRTKVLTREAFRDLLPQDIIEGGRTGSLGSFYLRGIERRREDLARWLFARPRSDWQRYVRREWLEPYLHDTRSIAFGHTILWRVVSYELWCRRGIGGR